MENNTVKIGNLELDNPLILAPLSGVTSLPFRLLAKKSGAAMVATEMVSAAGLSQGGRKTLEIMVSHPSEKPLTVQIFGSKPEWMAIAAAKAQEAGADVVDINMGCPVRKVVRNGSGSALLQDFGLIRKILEAVRPAITIPLTVKTRLGWKPGQGEISDLAPILADCGVDAVCLHARWAIQKFGGDADWSAISKLVEIFPGPVIGNGDIKLAIHAVQMLKETGCAAVMIGRGAMGKPWIFTQALDYLAGRRPQEIGLFEIFNTARDHAMMIRDRFGPERSVFMLRGIWSWYTKGLGNAAAFRGEMNMIKDFDLMLEKVDEYFHRLMKEEKFIQSRAQAV